MCFPMTRPDGHRSRLVSFVDPESTETIWDDLDMSGTTEWPLSVAGKYMKRVGITPELMPEVNAPAKTLPIRIARSQAPPSLLMQESAQEHFHRRHPDVWGDLGLAPMSQ